MTSLFVASWVCLAIASYIPGKAAEVFKTVGLFGLWTIIFTWLFINL